MICNISLILPFYFLFFIVLQQIKKYIFKMDQKYYCPNSTKELKHSLDNSGYINNEWGLILSGASLAEDLNEWVWNMPFQISIIRMTKIIIAQWQTTVMINLYFWFTLYFIAHSHKSPWNALWFSKWIILRCCFDWYQLNNLSSWQSNIFSFRIYYLLNNKIVL